MNCCVVKVHSVPRRGRSSSSMLSPAQRGQSGWVGNVTTGGEHAVHRLATRRGPSSVSRNNPGATGTCWLSCMGVPSMYGAVLALPVAGSDLLAVDDVEVAIVVLAGHVARVEPLVAQRLRGELGALPIPVGHDAAAHADLADVAAPHRSIVVVQERDRDSGQRSTTRAEQMRT